jgi:lysophospholipase L1-like esterase
MFRRVGLAIALLGAGVAFGGTSVSPPPQALQPSQPQQQAKLLPGDFLAVCGDSITEQKLYCRFIEEYLLMCQPENLRIMQFGWNGETSWGFLGKMPTEAMRFHPSAVTICFGMNDGGYAEVETNYDRYRRSLHGIIQNFKKDGVKLIVLGSPGVVDTQTFWGGVSQAAKYNVILGRLRDVGREVAHDEGVVFADIHDPMNEVMTKAKAKYGKAYALAGQEDGVHPDENGHLVMADVFLKALGCDGNIGTITLDLPSGTAQASKGHKILSCHNGVVEVESTKYPFCFFGSPSSPKSPKGILEFLPFNQDLNRFELVVKGARSQKVRVTWGNASKEFSGADAERGINLAAEFYDNPFSAAFLRVEQAVEAQQNYETPLVKKLIHEMNDLESLVPDQKATMESVEAAGMRKAHELFEQTAKRVEPVRHTIRVELVK